MSSLVDVMNAMIAPTLVVTFMVEVLGVPVYLAQFYLILRNRAERLSGFYMLFMFRAALVILYLYPVNFAIRLPTLNLFLDAYQKLPNAAFTYSWYLQPLCIYGEFVANAAMLANRYTAIAYPIQYKKIWAPKYTFGYILLMLAFVVPWGIPFLSVKGCVFPSNGTFLVYTCVPLPEGQEDPQIGFTAHNMELAIAFMAIGVALNLATWRAFKHGAMGQSNGSAGAKVERKLTQYAVISTVGWALQAMFYIAVWVLNQQGAFSPALVAFVLLFLPLSIDTLCFALPAALLFWASAEMRSGLAQLLGTSRATTVTRVAPSGALTTKISSNGAAHQVHITMNTARTH